MCSSYFKKGAPLFLPFFPIWLFSWRAFERWSIINMRLCCILHLVKPLYYGFPTSTPDQLPAHACKVQMQGAPIQIYMESRTLPHVSTFIPHWSDASVSTQKMRIKELSLTFIWASPQLWMCALDVPLPKLISMQTGFQFPPNDRQSTRTKILNGAALASWTRLLFFVAFT